MSSREKTQCRPMRADQTRGHAESQERVKPGCCQGQPMAKHRGSPDAAAIRTNRPLSCRGTKTIATATWAAVLQCADPGAWAPGTRPPRAPKKGRRDAANVISVKESHLGCARTHGARSGGGKALTNGCPLGLRVCGPRSRRATSPRGVSSYASPAFPPVCSAGHRCSAKTDPARGKGFYVTQIPIGASESRGVSAFQPETLRDGADGTAWQLGNFRVNW
jgi:hypothetical protein